MSLLDTLLPIIPGASNRLSNLYPRDNTPGSLLGQNILQGGQQGIPTLSFLSPGGAALGGTIGSIISPGAGTVIGGSIGAVGPSLAKGAVSTAGTAASGAVTGGIAGFGVGMLVGQPLLGAGIGAAGGAGIAVVAKAFHAIVDESKKLVTVWQKLSAVSEVIASQYQDYSSKMSRTASNWERTHENINRQWAHATENITSRVGGIGQGFAQRWTDIKITLFKEFEPILNTMVTWLEKLANYGLRILELLTRLLQNILDFLRLILAALTDLIGALVHPTRAFNAIGAELTHPGPTAVGVTGGAANSLLGGIAGIAKLVTPQTAQPTQPAQPTIQPTTRPTTQPSARANLAGPLPMMFADASGKSDLAAAVADVLSHVETASKPKPGYEVPKHGRPLRSKPFSHIISDFIASIKDPAIRIMAPNTIETAKSISDERLDDDEPEMDTGVPTAFHNVRGWHKFGALSYAGNRRHLNVGMPSVQPPRFHVPANYNQQAWTYHQITQSLQAKTHRGDTWKHDVQSDFEITDEGLKKWLNNLGPEQLKWVDDFLQHGGTLLDAYLTFIDTQEKTSGLGTYVTQGINRHSSAWKVSPSNPRNRILRAGTAAPPKIPTINGPEYPLPVTTTPTGPSGTTFRAATTSHTGATPATRPVENGHDGVGFSAAHNQAHSQTQAQTHAQVQQPPLQHGGININVQPAEDFERAVTEALDRLNHILVTKDATSLIRAFRLKDEFTYA